jgi:hypothetical protein
MVSNRCQFSIIDLSTNRGRLCKYKKKIMCYCHIHSNKILYNYAIIIQKIFKGYYTRRKLKIFYKLPRDLQRKVIWHLNKDIYTRHFHASIANLIYKKLNHFNNNTSNLQFITLKSYTDLFAIQYFIEDHKDNEYTIFKEELRYIIKLLIKYNIIIDISNVLTNLLIISNYCEVKYCLNNTQPFFYNTQDKTLFKNFNNLLKRIVY